MGGKKKIISKREFIKTFQKAKEESKKFKPSFMNETKPIKCGKYYLPPMPFFNPNPPMEYDYMRKDGAKYLADYIQDYWHKLGYTKAHFWIDKEGTDKYVIRSNLVNGIPPLR